MIRKLLRRVFRRGEPSPHRAETISVDKHGTP